MSVFLFVSSAMCLLQINTAVKPSCATLTFYPFPLQCVPTFFFAVNRAAFCAIVAICPFVYMPLFCVVCSPTRNPLFPTPLLFASYKDSHHPSAIRLQWTVVLVSTHSTMSTCVALYHWTNWKNNNSGKKKRHNATTLKIPSLLFHNFLNESCLEILHWNAYCDLLLLEQIFFLYWTLLQCVLFVYYLVAMPVMCKKQVILLMIKVYTTLGLYQLIPIQDVHQTQFQT